MVRITAALFTLAAAGSVVAKGTLFNDFAYDNKQCYQCLHAVETSCPEGDDLAYARCFCSVPGDRWSAVEKCLNSAACQESGLEAPFTLGAFGQFCVLRDEAYYNDYCDPAKRSADPLVERLGHIMCTGDHVWTSSNVPTSTTAPVTSSDATTPGTPIPTEPITTSTAVTPGTTPGSPVPTTPIPTSTAVTPITTPKTNVTSTLKPTVSLNTTITIDCTSTTTKKSEDCTTLTTTKKTEDCTNAAPTTKKADCTSCAPVVPASSTPCHNCLSGSAVPTAPVVVTGGAAGIMTGATGLAAFVAAALLL
ncbi:hypothetical protein PWT90_07061 [Aphanocladium album]|nr:hypothetical protein PWT90_07061 [Aphanocladium album]